MFNRRIWFAGFVVLILAIIAVILINHKPSPQIASNQSKAINSSTPSSNVNTTNRPASATVTNAIIKTKEDATIGNYLTDPAGNALYTYGKDTTDTSNCSGSCLSTWPDYNDTATTENLPGEISFIHRTDNGDNQYTYKKQPLYYFSSDQPGQASGNNVAGFTLARP